MLGRHKLSSILLSALLTVAALMLFVRLPNAPEGVTVAEQNGVYDLTGITDLNTSFIRLTPGGAYYPNTYLTPENSQTAEPESTSRFDEIRADFLSCGFLCFCRTTGCMT